MKALYALRLIYFVTLSENSTVVTNATHLLCVSTPPEIVVGTDFHAHHGTRTTPIFLRANREFSWLLLVVISKFGLLPIRWHSAATKHLF